MPIKFNPLAGQFDLVGSGGGGGSSYIDGEVQNFSALPETLGSPAVDSAYLVREAEGTWLLNRKPAGIYIRTANTGTRASDWTHASAFPDVFNDANLVVYSNGDSSKNLAFNVGGITTGTTRTLTAPDASGTIALTEDFAAPPAIGNTTPNSGAFTTLSANNGTLTASAPVLSLAQTWNDSGTAFTAIKVDITNTASNLAGSKILDISVGGTGNVLNIYRSTNSAFQAPMFEFGSGGVTSRMRVRTGGGVGVNFDGMVGVGGSLQLGVSTGTSSGDVILSRDAANTLAQVNGTNAQTFNIYNTSSSANANYERGFMRWSSNVLQIGTEKAGTGSARALELRTDNTARLTFGASGTITLNTTLAADAQNISTDTTTGTKIGTGTTQKIGFFNATPVVQQAAVADATDAASTQARLNDLLARLRTLGLIAT